MLIETLEKLKNSKVLYLTTTGRNSGEPRSIEIWFVYAQGNIYLISGMGMSSNWVKNLLKDPQVKVQIKDSSLSGKANVVPPKSEARDQVARLYQRKYRWQIEPEATIVEITPEGPG